MHSVCVFSLANSPMSGPTLWDILLQIVWLKAASSLLPLQAASETLPAMQGTIATFLAFAALFQGAAGHVHCCSCCNAHKNTCDSEDHEGWGVASMCKYQGNFVMCNEAAAQNHDLFFTDCDDDLLGLSKPVSRGQLVTMAVGLFAGGLATAAGLVIWQRRRPSVVEVPLLA